MVANGNQDLKDILNCFGKSASDMTQRISAFGNGDMATGIVQIYNEGFKEGRRITAGFTGIAAATVVAGILCYKTTQWVANWHHTRKALSQAENELLNQNPNEQNQHGFQNEKNDQEEMV